MPVWGGWFGARRREAATTGTLVTWRLAPGQRRLDERERDVVFRLVLAGNGSRCEVAALVVMDDHVRVLLRASPSTSSRLSRSWMAGTSHQLQRIHRRSAEIWAADADVTAVGSEDAFRELADRVLADPWKRWPFLQGYPWVYHGI